MSHDYNTQRKRMSLPEYGRNVQKMIDHIKTIKDRKERSRAARTVVQIMSNLNPGLREYGDIDHKLWDHLAIISQFELDIDAPYPPPEKEKLLEKPKIVSYKNGEIKFRHYGRIVEMMADAACKMEDGKEKNYLIILIANQMKKSSSAWNSGQIPDEIIFRDLIEMSDNRITIPEGAKLMDIKELLGPKKKKNHKQGKYPRKKFQGRH